MMSVFAGRYGLRGQRCTSTTNTISAAIVYDRRITSTVVARFDRSAIILHISRRHCYPTDGFYGHHDRNGSSELIISQFSRCASSTTRLKDIAPRRVAIRDPDMRQCKTIEELVHLAYSHIDYLSPRGKSAFWSLLVKHIQNQSGGGNNTRVQLSKHLDVILCNTMESMSYNFDGREIATIAISLAKLMKLVEFHEQKAAAATATDSLHQTLQDLLIGGINKSEKKQVIFDKVAKTSAPILSKFDARCLSNLIYSYCLAEYVPKVKNDRTILDVLAPEAISKLQYFNCQELSNMLWSYAKMKSTNSLLFNTAGDFLVGLDNLGEFKPQELSNIIWSYATAGESHPRLYKIFADHIVAMKELRNFWPQALSNILWSYATAGEAHPKLFSKLGDHIVAMKDLNAFKPQALSNIVWAYATTFQSHPRLFSKFADHIITMMDLGLFKPQALSNIIWSFATTGQTHPKLYKKLADHIASLDDLNRFIPQELSNIVWSYATTSQSHPRLFSKVSVHISTLDDLSEFLPQDSSNILWSYATAGESRPFLFQTLADMAISRCNDFKPRELSNLLWACATVGIIDRHLFASFAPAVKSVMGHCSSQALANIAWSYAVANVNEPLLFDADFIDVCQARANDFSSEGYGQLHQWQLWQNEIKSGINLPPALREKCRQAFVSQSYQSSTFQDDVISVLLSISMSPKDEFLTLSGYRLDALVKVNGEKVGIEVDGPYHFMNQEPTGSTLLKRRQVSTLDGIHIVSVPYWDWDGFGMEDHTKKRQYLRSKLGLRPV